jgi:hypothetical protein
MAHFRFKRVKLYSFGKKTDANSPDNTDFNAKSFAPCAPFHRCSHVDFRRGHALIQGLFNEQIFTHPCLVCGGKLGHGDEQAAVIA